MTDKTSYTDTLDDKQAMAVRRIIARHGDHFRTCYLASDSGTDSGFGVKWREAWLIDEDSQSWAVEEYQTAPDIYPDQYGRLPESGKIALKIKDIDGGICFFDALHGCAVFEVTASNYDLTPVRFEQAGANFMHYADFAAHEGIPFEKKTNLPVPAINGRRLLTDNTENSTFDMDLHDTLARSKGNLIPEEQVKAAFLKTVMDDTRKKSAVTSMSLRHMAERSRNLKEATQPQREDFEEKKQAIQNLKQNKERLRSAASSLIKLKNKFNTESLAAYQANRVTGWLGFSTASSACALTSSLALSTGSVLLGAAAGISGLFSLGAAEWVRIGHINSFDGEYANLKALTYKITKNLEGPLGEDAAQLKKEVIFSAASLRYHNAAFEVSLKGSLLKQLEHTMMAKELHKACAAIGMSAPEIKNWMDILDHELEDNQIDHRIARYMNERLEEFSGHLKSSTDGREVQDIKALPPLASSRKLQLFDPNSLSGPAA